MLVEHYSDGDTFGDQEGAEVKGIFTSYEEAEAFAKANVPSQFARRLNGQKFLIWGNHDKRLRKSKAFTDQWIWCKELAQIEVDEETQLGTRTTKIILCHFAMRTWNQSHRGSWQLYGHSHGTLPDDPNALSLDVGVDAWDYFPAAFEEIGKRMAKKTWKAIDHHDKRDL